MGWKKGKREGTWNQIKFLLFSEGKYFLGVHQCSRTWPWRRWWHQQAQTIVWDPGTMMWQTGLGSQRSPGIGKKIRNTTLQVSNIDIKMRHFTSILNTSHHLSKSSWICLFYSFHNPFSHFLLLFLFPPPPHPSFQSNTTNINTCYIQYVHVCMHNVVTLFIIWNVDNLIFINLNH